MKNLKEEELIKKARENKRMKLETNLRYRGKCFDP
jgi:hypothetical protein